MLLLHQWSFSDGGDTEKGCHMGMVGSVGNECT